MLSLNIKKSYGSFMLDADFALDNDILAIMGSSGAGKTTLLECISGLTSPDEGEIILNNRVLFSSMRKINLNPGKRKIGMVFQYHVLFPHLTVMGNVLFSKNRVTEEDRDTAVKLLKDLNIDHLKDRLPDEISGGERQRVAIARALIMHPDILLFDEPTSSLDRRTARDVFRLIKTISADSRIPVIIATHDELVKGITDNILYLSYGRQFRIYGYPIDGVKPQD
ncbi:MAG: ATP-binding cassette domain-containing protein [Thermoanaerobacteraceae bacterium]|nr:ATP-binding cassette domain-containing protein [Thermoanaerobacteraceae bacterium]